MCSGLLVQKDLMLLPLELKLYRTLWSVDVVCAGVCAGLLGEGSAALGLRHTFLRKPVPAKQGGVWFGVSSLGHHWLVLLTEVSLC